jgi:hypothetical protein
MPPSDQERFARFLVGNIGSEGEQKAYCPLHEDPDTSDSPSASFNWGMGVWNCLVCPGGGSIRALKRDLMQRRRQPTPQRQPKEREDNVTPLHRGKELPTDEQIQLWHERLLNIPDKLRVMTQERGLLQETLEEFSIGWDGNRYTIPVYDGGTLVNVRRYNPSASKAGDKMLNIEGHGQARIFLPEFLVQSNEVVLTEGEMDCILARQYGLPAVTHTAGAGTFLPVWAGLFSGKDVYICFDCDDAGRKGAMKAARHIIKYANMVCIMDLDLDIKGGDITDFFVKQGNTPEEFRLLMDAASKSPVGARKPARELPTDGKAVSLEESQSVQYGNEPLALTVSVAGKRSPAYVVPRRIVARCTQDKGNVCTVCPMAARNGEAVEEIPPNDPVLLEFIDANKKAVQTSYREMFAARCQDRIEYETEQSWTMEELIVTNSVDHRTEEDQTPITRQVMNVGAYKTPVNTVIKIVGQQFPDPRSQRGMFMGWHSEQTQTDLDTFEVNEEIMGLLKRFQPKPGQSPLAKCRAIATDLAANVTHIYGRDELHVAYDLVWHSVISFKFLGKLVDKGWLELLVVGDTRTGKSEAAHGLSRHYNAGIVKSCEGATFAGLVGGAQQLGGKAWSVTWGIIPLQDRRLVVLDEMSGLADKDVIEQMSSIRSSGRAQITKIQQDETSARTRLIWIANPADGRRLQDTPGSGMTAIGTLVKNPEDIARFDIAMAASGDDVPVELINTSAPPTVRHRYTSRACEALVLWAWSRTADNVLWDAHVEEQIVEAATELGARYVSEPPLVQVENIRMKLARIAVSMAARLFSTDDGERLIVRGEHVQAAVEFLDMVYGMESFGYLRHSRKVLAGRKLAEDRKSMVYRYLKENPGVLHALQTVGSDRFRTRDFVDFAAMDQYEAQAATRFLMENRMVQRLAKGYMRMEPAMTAILNRFEDEEERRLTTT